MRILLLNPTALKPMIPPLGLEYIGEHLQSKGHDVIVADKIETVDLEDIIGSLNPYIIGVQIRNLDNCEMLNSKFYLPEIREEIAKLKTLSDAPIVVGGTAVNLMPEAVRSFVGADYAVATKGFKALDMLLVSIEHGEKLPPVIRDFSDTVNGTFKRGLIAYAPYMEQGAMTGVATKFGCPYSCTYCDYPIADGRIIKQRNPSEVVDEVAQLKEQGVNYIFFADANFNIPAAYGSAVLRAMHQSGITVIWDAFLNPHPKSFTSEFFDALLKSGKQHVNLGVDSLHDPTLEYFQKKFTVSDVERATKMCQESGIKVSYSMLFGSPLDTEDAIKITFGNLDKLQPHIATIDIGLRVYAGTPLYTQLLKDGTITTETDVLHPFFLPVRQELIELINREASMRNFCTKPALDKYMVKAHNL